MKGKQPKEIIHGNTKVAELRISYLVGARLKDRDRIAKALRKQDEIRKRHPAPKGWNSTYEVRRWREKQ